MPLKDPSHLRLAYLYESIEGVRAGDANLKVTKLTTLKELAIKSEDLFRPKELCWYLMSGDSRLPTVSDFPPGTEFMIKEFDVPLARLPNGTWFNWYGGKPRQYDVRFLKVDNNWRADSFEEWVGLIEDSLPGRGDPRFLNS